MQKSFIQERKQPSALKVDLSTLHRWTKAGKIISHAIGGRVFYKESSIQQALVKLDPNQNIRLW